jgi:DNA-binding MarR family transcriptional regulator
MGSPATDLIDTDAIDELAHTLPGRALRLTRLSMAHVHGTITRSMLSMLVGISDAPQRVSELARLEGLSQPRATLLIRTLEDRGWARRERDDRDRRAVNVWITDDGRALLAELRERLAGVLGAALESMTPEQIQALQSAGDAVDALIHALEAPASLPPLQLPTRTRTDPS